MRAAVEGRGGANLKLLAVTVLTSFDREDLADDGLPMDVPELVRLRVRKAMECGIDGIVARRWKPRRCGASPDPGR